jgi:chromosome segregation ATPase
MSNPGGFIGSGVGGGVQWDKNADLEWRLKQMQDDMKFIWNRLADLEAARDQKVEPYDKRDAGEPVNKHYIECLKQNARLIEENDVLRYQYEAMKNETARCKAQLDQFEKIVANKQKVLEMTMDQRDAAQWYREQAIKKCIDIVEKNKNDPLTRGECKRWMVAICEDIQRAIKYEFGVK